MKNIAETIKEVRRKLGLTQEEFASRLFVTRQAVSGWERGKNLPDIEKLKLMSQMFDTPLDDMLFKDIERVRELSKIYKYITYCFIVLVVSLISVGIYQVFNPPHIVLLRSFEGVCSDENISITYVSENNKYLIESSETIKFEFGDYCIPLKYEVTLSSDNTAVTRLEHSLFWVSNISIHNPFIEVEDIGDGYRLNYYSYFRVVERVSFSRYGDQNLRMAFKGVSFEVPYEMLDEEKVEVSANRTDDWRVLLNE